MAKDCIEKVAANVVANCTTQGVGGNKVKAWLLDLNDDWTFVFTLLMVVR